MSEDSKNQAGKRARVDSGQTDSQHGGPDNDLLTMSGMKTLLDQVFDKKLAEFGLTKLKTEFDSFVEGFKFNEECLQETKVKVEKCEEEIQGLRSELSEVKTALAAERQARLKQECHERRYNLRFLNIPEDKNESDRQTEIKLKRVITEYYDIEDSDLSFERVHRMPGTKPKDDSQKRPPRPIIARFTYFKDRECIWKEKKLLSGSNVYVKEDFPPEIAQRVDIMLPIFHAARRDKSLRVRLVIDKLYINNTMYTVETIHRLPDHLKPENLAIKVTDDVIYFYRKDAYLSNFHGCEVRDDKVKYNCSEQYYKAKMAITFKDKEAYDLIMKSDNPSFQKSVRIKNYDHKVWLSVCRTHMKDALYLKFCQNLNLKQKLLDTGNKKLCEASPNDSYWGAGLSMHNPKILDKSNWGQNNLGKLLEEIRYELRPKDSDSDSDTDGSTDSDEDEDQSYEEMNTVE